MRRHRAHYDLIVMGIAFLCDLHSSLQVILQNMDFLREHLQVSFIFLSYLESEDMISMIDANDIMKVCIYMNIYILNVAGFLSLEYHFILITHKCTVKYLI